MQSIGIPALRVAVRKYWFSKVFEWFLFGAKATFLSTAFAIYRSGIISPFDVICDCRLGNAITYGAHM